MRQNPAQKPRDFNGLYVETLRWERQVRGSVREDRMLTSVDVSIPPLIDHLDYVPSLPAMIATEKARLAVDYAKAITGSRSNPSAVSMVAALPN